MRKPGFCMFLHITWFCIRKNKGTDQLRGYCAFVCATYIVQFLYIHVLPKPLAIFSDCIARFVSDLVGNPEGLIFQLSSDTHLFSLDDSSLVYLFRFLGYIDKIGVAYESPSVASGYGAYIAQVCIDKI